MVKKLKLAYQELGSFQQIDRGDNEAILNPKISKDTDSSKKAQENLTIYDKYLETSISERKSLFQEIENYINDLKYMIQNEN